ncbi:MAG: hemolysin family protein [Aquabacterium sp.]
MDVALLTLLILLNGIFAMSEMALTAARKARLAVMQESGDALAAAALDLHEHPTKYLSTVQIGITSIGVLNGIVGEAAFAAPLAHWMQSMVTITERAAAITATALVVVCITFLTIIFGELVPKRIGQMFPETVARLVARPMEWLSSATRPFVWLLSASTEAVLRMFGLRHGPSRSVTEEEIAASLEEGVDAGVIEEQEHQMVRNVFRLDERQVGSMMITRSGIVWLDLDASLAQLMDVLGHEQHARYPVCRGGLDDVVGVVEARHLLRPLAEGRPVALDELMRPAVFVPETLTGMELIEHFRASETELVFVVDEYGSVQGVITLRDLMEAIAGEFHSAEPGDAWAVQRADGSWLVDGLMPATELKDRLEIDELPQEDRGRYNTLAGMVMLLLGRLPHTADVVEWQDWRFEVVDLDGKRVDKVLASRIPFDIEETAS